MEQLVASPPKLSAARRELLRLLLEPGRSPPDAVDLEPPLVRLEPGAQRPLSLAQERIWLASRLVGDVRGGTTTGLIRLTGPLDEDALRRALAELVRRHEILRTSFPGDVAPHAVVHPPTAAELLCVDLSALPEAQRTSEVQRLLAEEANQPFQLDRLPLVRVKLLRLSEHEHQLLVSTHHILTDGWSSGLMFAELSQLYGAFTSGRAASLPEPTLQYADFAAWQRRCVETARVKRQLEYWKEQLAGQIPPVELPADRPRTAKRTFRGATHAFELSPALSQAVLSLCKDAGTTPFTTLLAAFATLVQRLTGQDEMAFGSPVANRNRRELESIVGCFMHPLVMRLRLGDNPTFRELLARVRDVCLAAYANQDAPFELVMREIRPQWDAVHTPLFQILFNVLRAETARLELTGLSVGTLELHTPAAALDLSVNLWVGDGRIRGLLEYAADLFDEGTIRWLLRGYESLLASIVANPDRKLSELPVTGRVKARPLPAALLAPDLSPQRRELLELLLGHERDELDLARLPARQDGEQLPCSFGQERLWLVEQMQPDGAVFNQSQSLLLEGPLDVAALRYATDEIVRRHEIIRTGIVATSSGPVQIVHPAAPFDLPLVDLSQLSVAEQKVESRRLLDEIANRPFQLDQPPLVRAVLIRLGPTRNLLGFTVHHLVSDGWSTRVFRRELAALYQARTMGQASPLAEAPLQYADFARWQRQFVREAMLQGQLAYWKDRLFGELPRLELPADRARSAALAIGRNVALPFALPDSLATDLGRLQRDTGATPFMVLLAAFFALLNRYSGQDDAIVDTPTSGRTRRELESLIGFFVNSLVLRVDLADRPTFRELVARVRTACLDAFANQDVPFDQVVSRLNLARDRRGQPLTPVSFMLHETVVKHEELGAGVTIVPGPYDSSDEFDLTMIVWQSPTGRFTGDLQFDPRLFTREAAGRIAAHYQTLLAEQLAHPDQSIADLPLMPPGEQSLVLDAWSRGAPAAVHGPCIHELFEAQVRATPGGVAVVAPAEDSSLTYDQLNRRANQLARHLRSLGVAAEHRVGICLDRSPDLIVAVWAVLKAGAAFVPLDAGYSSQRLADMIRDARLTLLVTQPGLVADEYVAGIRTLMIDRERDQMASHADDNLGVALSDQQLVYVVYTSGSTGKPKGVMISHRSLVNAYRGWETSYRLREMRSHLQMASFSFDVFVGDFVRALCSGARLVLCPRDALLIPKQLVSLLEKYEIDCAEFVPAVVRLLLEHLRETGQSLPHLRLAIVGSDIWTPAEYKQVHAALGPQSRVINSYGVAEATIDSSFFEQTTLAEPDDEHLPVGRPFAGCELLVLDRYLQPLPIGVPGELYLGGVGLARGYFDRPALTAERFVPHPLSRHPGERLYRTGDRARWLPDGNLEFLGRADFQLKIRGFRIEPGEIEACLCRHAAVRRTIVIARGDNRQRHLVAYVVAAAPSAGNSSTNLPAELRSYLREQLPEYMVPAAIVVLDRLPLSPNGKVDRRALPPPPDVRPSSAPLNPPQSDAERRIAAIWSQILGLAEVGLTDNFFDLGGHSLLLFELHSKLHTAFGQEIPLIELFRLPTVQDQARRLAAVATPADSPRDAIRQRSERQRQSLSKQHTARAARRRAATPADHE